MTKNTYVCQTQQVTKFENIEVMFQPALVFPLDNITNVNMVESLVAFPDIPVHETSLLRPADFLGSQDSYLELARHDHFGKYGLTISVWVNIKYIQNSLATIVSFKKDALSNNFHLYIKDNKLEVQLCNSSACETFSSSSEVKNGFWTFVCFTFDNEVKKGIFYINETSGYHIHEQSHFKYDTKYWFDSIASNGPLRIGSEGFQNQSGKNYFRGKMSCFQLFTKYLSPSQVYQLKKTCYLNQTHIRSQKCPDGFFLMNGHCYKFSLKPLSFAEAEQQCVNNSNSMFTTRLAYPKDYFSQEMLLVYAQTKFIKSELWFGLDSRSGKDISLTCNSINVLNSTYAIN